MSTSRRFVVVAGALSLAGCMVGPDYRKPPPATPPTPEFKETSDSMFRPALPRDTIDRGPWWNVYGDPELDRLMAQVEVSNQTLKQNEAAYRQAVALIRQTQSQLFPTIGYTGNVLQRSSGGGVSSTGTSGGSVGNSQGQFSVGGSLSWEIDLWGRIRRTIESDAAAAQASAGDLAAARLSIQSSLATNYFSLRVSDRRRRLFEESVAAYARSLQIVQNQVDAGTASRLDLVQAQTILQQTRAQLVVEGVNRAQFEHAIAALIGKAPAEVSIAPAPLPATVPTIDAGIPSALLERRPDIAAAERQMASANAQVGVAVAAYYPDITLGASINFASTVLGTLFTMGSAVWSIGPALAGTAIDGGARGAQVEGARANYDRTVALYRQTVLTAFQQVEDGLVQQRLIEQQEKVQEAAVAAAREAERLSLNQYRAGTVPYTTVIQTQTAALSAEQSLINVRLNRFTASSTLVTALGGGWKVQDLPIPAATPSSDPAPAPAPPRRRWWPF
ncbi:MAG: efflux transporter outer membrane subunit [Proteobacteria bacterium]|nr:efflux transporter outer membrane subunit [Pseudomonadota bacterium]